MNTNETKDLQFQIDYVKALLEKAQDEYEVQALEEELDELELKLMDVHPGK